MAGLATKPNYKLIVFSIFIIMAFAITMTGCSKNSSSANPSLAEINEKISQSIDMSNLQECDSKKLEKFYDISADELEDFVLYTSSVNIKADEIAVFKLKDKDRLGDIQKKIDKRLENKADSFKDYLPEEYFLIEKHVLVSQDNYILFAISKDAKSIEDIFNGFF